MGVCVEIVSFLNTVNYTKIRMFMGRRIAERFIAAGSYFFAAQRRKSETSKYEPQPEWAEARVHFVLIRGCVISPLRA